jgi:predicted  nucleic acid-binding Zn-ribbon protein
MMDLEIDAASSDVIAMNLTIAALDQWLKDVSSSRSGEELGREIAALYREIHAAVDEMTPGDDEDDEYEDDDEEEEDEEFDEDDEDEEQD